MTQTLVIRGLSDKVTDASAFSISTCSWSKENVFSPHKKRSQVEKSEKSLPSYLASVTKYLKKQTLKTDILRTVIEYGVIASYGLYYLCNVHHGGVVRFLRVMACALVLVKNFTLPTML